MTAEELTAMVIARGLTVADLDKFTFGMLINYCCAYDRQQKRARGEKVHDPEEQYKKLKKLEPVVEQRYQAGLIKKEDYDRFIGKLRRWENG